MVDQRENAIRFAHTNKDNFLRALEEILSIPSISTDKTHLPDIQRAAGWLAAQLRALGMQKVQLFPTSLSPIVYGEFLGVPGAPTVLIYGHYDVQPVDPLELWQRRKSARPTWRHSLPVIPICWPAILPSIRIQACLAKSFLPSPTVCAAWLISSCVSMVPCTIFTPAGTVAWCTTRPTPWPN
jgi:hypothetical protein